MLLADRETVSDHFSERVQGRALGAVLGRDRAPRRESCAVAALDRCLTALRPPDFATHVWTDDLTVPQVADRAAVATAGVALPPDPDGPVRAWGLARGDRPAPPAVLVGLGPRPSAPPPCSRCG